MVLNEIDSIHFRDMVRVATHRLGKNAEFFNLSNQLGINTKAVNVIVQSVKVLDE